MMTLEEAIKHCEDVISDGKCDSCVNEHRQLMEWLKELEERRQQPEIIMCKHRKNFRRFIGTNFKFCDRTETEVSENDFCSFAERINYDSV